MSKGPKQSFAVVCLLAGSALASPCSDPSTPHVISGNFSVDLYGPVDTGPGTYGHADYVIWNQTFQNVPAGCRVQILHISGDFFRWPAGTTLVGASAGVLVAANRSSAGGSTHAA
jgi:hypothetical protein